MTNLEKSAAKLTRNGQVKLLDVEVAQLGRLAAWTPQFGTAMQQFIDLNEQIRVTVSHINQKEAHIVARLEEVPQFRKRIANIESNMETLCQGFSAMLVTVNRLERRLRGVTLPRKAVRGKKKEVSA